MLLRKNDVKYPVLDFLSGDSADVSVNYYPSYLNYIELY